MNKKDLNDVAKKNKGRLHKIQEKLNKSNITTIAQLKSIGGSATFYSALAQSPAIIKHNNRWMWNDKIPVSMKLAKTLSEKSRDMNNNTRIKTTQKVNVIEPNIINKRNKITNQNKSKRTNSLLHTNPNGYKFSFGWGLLSYEKF